MRVLIEPGDLGMKIMVNPPPHSRRESGLVQNGIELEVPGNTLRGLLAEFSNKYRHREKIILSVIDPKSKEVELNYEVSINGKKYESLLHGLDTELKDGDQVEIMMDMLGGG